MKKVLPIDLTTENEEAKARAASLHDVGAAVPGANTTDKVGADQAGGDTRVATTCVDSADVCHPFFLSESTTTDSTGWDTVSADSGASVSNHDLLKSPAVCRICHVGQEKETEEPVLNSLCKCRAHLGALHASCLRRWMDIRGRRDCEICKSLFHLQQLSPPPYPQQDCTTSGSTTTGSSIALSERGWVRMRRFATLLGLGGLATFVLVLLIRLDLFHRKATLSGQTILDDKTLFGTREKLVIFSSLTMVLLVLYSLSWICEEMAHAAGRASFQHVHHHHHHQQQSWLPLLPLARREVAPSVV